MRLQKVLSCLTVFLFWDSWTLGALGFLLLQQLLWQVTSCCLLERPKRPPPDGLVMVWTAATGCEAAKEVVFQTADGV